MDLAKRTPGRARPGVTSLGGGAMQLSGFNVSASRRHVQKLLNQALDCGSALIDSSPDSGGSEELLGEAISEHRNEFFLASQCGCPAATRPTTRGERE